MINITSAFLSAGVLSTAVELSLMGMSVVPTSGKRALVAWKQYTERAAQPNHVARWYSRYPQADGVAIICGRVSRRLVIVDLDGEDAVEAYEYDFPALLDTLTVRTGSGLGKHYYYQVDVVPPTNRSKGVEVRSDGAYCIAPPSRHPSGNRYTIENLRRVMTLADMAMVLEFVDARKPLPPPPPTTIPPIKTYSGYNPRWVRSAVERELTNLRAATEGSHNNVLNAVSYRLARICANPNSGLNRVQLQTDILSAAAAYIHRDGLKQATATMESGWNAGYANPVHIPEPRYSNGTR